VKITSNVFCKCTATFRTQCILWGSLGLLQTILVNEEISLMCACNETNLMDYFTFYSKHRPPSIHSSFFFFVYYFHCPYRCYHYSTYHQLVTRAQTTVLNWCKEQLYIPLFMCMNCQSNKDLFKKMRYLSSVYPPDFPDQYVNTT
jgi:hypothetical protein